jgi:ATP-dependent protease ClpP protease subunit
MPRALERWDAGVHAAAEEDARTISIYDAIGYDYWTGEGVTAKRVAGALRAMGKGAVTVNINSPGGDVFEGLSIYNLLREHSGEVTVKVIGLAASAASVIAMAADNLQIARSGFLMIHNAWSGAVGNRNDFRDFADWLEPFDRAIADIYAARTGKDQKAIMKLMDGELWMGGSDAIDQGFADELLPSDDVASGATSKASAHAVRRMELALRGSGMAKQEAMTLISEFKTSLRDVTGTDERDAIEVRLEPLPKLSFSI